jgi:RHS repeat-associated protein
VDLTYIKLVSETNGEGGDQYAGLDRFYRVVDQRWRKPSDGSHVCRQKHAYDRASNKLYTNDLVFPALSELYHTNDVPTQKSYDPLSRLLDFRRGVLTASGLNGTVLDRVPVLNVSDKWIESEQWTLDQLGNWPRVVRDDEPEDRTHDSQNELNTQTKESVTTTNSYDLNGNLKTNGKGDQYRWDAWNRLVEAKNSDGVILAVYSYDARDFRIRKMAGGVTTDVYHTPGWQEIEYRIGTAVKEQFVWSPVYIDALILRDRDADGNSANGLEERLYYCHNSLYTSQAVLQSQPNQSYSVSERYLYDPYGKVTFLNPDGTPKEDQNYSSLGNGYTYTGRFLDRETGLHYFRYRYYDAGLGRFVGRDPIVASHGI